MRAGKPFLIAGVPIAGLALHSLSSGSGAGVTSAWSHPRPTASSASSTAVGVGRSSGRRRHDARPHSTSSLSSPSPVSSRSNRDLPLFSASTNIDDTLLQSLHLTPELQMMTQAFATIPDEKTRHKQLLYMASKLPDVPESVRVPENKVPGCLSTVHVDCVVEAKKIDDADETNEEQLVVNYFGDSDGLLTKGLLALLIR
jgi:sulfur transfer protein SufE